MANDRLMFPRGPMLALAAASAVMTINIRPAADPRFEQMPLSISNRERGVRRAATVNHNAAKQAAAKRARKITRRRK